MRARKKNELRHNPSPTGITKVPHEGGGDCLFHSISRSIEFTDNQKHHHRQVRAAAVSHLKRHSDKYACFWDNKDPTGVDMDVSDRASAFQKYLGLVEKVGAWAGNLEIAALASSWTGQSISYMKLDRATDSTRRVHKKTFGFGIRVPKGTMNLSRYTTRNCFHFAYKGLDRQATRRTTRMSRRWQNTVTWRINSQNGVPWGQNQRVWILSGRPNKEITCGSQPG